MKVSKRNFLKYSTTLAITGALVNGSSLNTAIAAVSATKPEEKTVFTADAMCPAECGLEVKVQNGVLKKIYGNKAVPMNDGKACAKAASIAQLEYSPYRLKYPMMRVGERGSGEFKRISWDEAMDYIAKKLHGIKMKYGAESIIMNTGDVTDRDQYWRLFFAYGTPNCFEHGSICDTPRRHGPKLILGGKRIEPDIMRPLLIRDQKGNLVQDRSYKTKLIIYNGWNPFVATRIVYENRGTVGAKVENGCKIVVIDPSYSNTATAADVWLAPRAGTDGDLFGAMLRYIIENDNPKDKNKAYIDWSMKKYVAGWDIFIDDFKSWFLKVDPINNKSYFSIDWAADRTGLSAKQIKDLSHSFGITKPAALVWGMQSPGHHYNGYCASIIGTVLNVITGNFDVPGGVIDTETVKSNKGGNATGKQFKNRVITRLVNGKEVEGKVENLHKDLYGSAYPSAWDDVVADIPDLIKTGVEVRYGPFRGYHYPIKAMLVRTGNPVVTGSAPWKWQEAYTAKDKNGQYLLELSVFIDTLNLETALYADIILPEASFMERMSLSDIYPSHPVIYLRDEVIAPVYECKKPTEIMNLLAKKLVDLGDKDLIATDFWKKYKTEEDFVNEMLEPAPGNANVGTPLPYPKYPEGYKIIGTPESLENGNVKIDHEKKTVFGQLVTVEWLREHQGTAVWPMSYKRYKKNQTDEPNKIYPSTSTKLIEFAFDWEEDGKRYGRYAGYNKLLESAENEAPEGLKEIGLKKFPRSFYWFETKWNPYTNNDYKKYLKEYPLQLICGRVHHAMSGTQMVPWLAEIKTEGLWLPMNKEFTTTIQQPSNSDSVAFKEETAVIAKNTYSTGTVWMSEEDAKRMKIKTGDLIKVSNPLGKSTNGHVFVSGGIRPGIVKIGFATGGRFSKGIGAMYDMKDYTPSHNDLVDPNTRSPIMGFPIYADMMVNVSKIG